MAKWQAILEASKPKEAEVPAEAEVTPESIVASLRQPKEEVTPAEATGDAPIEPVAPAPVAEPQTPAQPVAQVPEVAPELKEAPVPAAEPKVEEPVGVASPAVGETKVDDDASLTSAEADSKPIEPIRLSNELDENGRQFVLTPSGQLEFGRIGKETGLTEAPILLSEGMITNPETNDGYGLAHIEARHGEQIRNAGYKSVLEFIETVAKNYEVIKEGSIRAGNQTYRLQLTDKHNNTLMVELSGDGTYWNINTAGIFKKSYGRNGKEVYNRHTTEKQSAETVEESQSPEQSGTQGLTSMNSPTTSVGKISEEVPTFQTKGEENIEATGAPKAEIEQHIPEQPTTDRILSDLRWSEERADNGEPFYISDEGKINLVEIPQDVFNAMGLPWMPFRLTPSMIAHVYDRHSKELKLKNTKDAVKAILDVMTNFDHVRQGGNGTFIFSVEKERTKSARRAITIVLGYDNGNWLGIKTTGFDRISNLKELTTLWEKGEKKTSATGVATANVTSDQSSQGNQTDGIASNQGAVNDASKGSEEVPTIQTKGEENIGEGLTKPETEAERLTQEALMTALGDVPGLKVEMSDGAELEKMRQEQQKINEVGQSSTAINFNADPSLSDANLNANVDNRIEITKESEQKLSELKGKINKEGALGTADFLLAIENALGSSNENVDKSTYFKDGQGRTLRVANHRASAVMFLVHGHPINNTSLVIKMSERRFKKNSNVDVAEFVYFEDLLNQEVQERIIDGLQGWIDTGEWGVASDLVNVSTRTTPELMRRADGVIYGAAVGDRILLNRDAINNETPIHEYAHLWSDAMRRRNPEGWQSVKDNLRGTPVWEEVVNDVNYSDIHGNEDVIASEVLSRLSGRNGRQKLEAMAEQMINEARSEGSMKVAEAVSLIERMRRALKKFWNWVGKDLFGIKKFGSVEEIQDRVLYDLLNGTDLKLDQGKDKGKFQIIGERGAEALDKAEEATTRLDNLAVAREMESAGKDAKAIRLATGWERGADGKWRYEISDIEPLDNPKVNAEGITTLGEIVDAKELFNAYPNLKKMRVMITDYDSLIDGMYDNGDIEINIQGSSIEHPDYTKAKKELETKRREFVENANSEGRKLNDKELSELVKLNLELRDMQHTMISLNNIDKSTISTLSHEIQHAIQEIEEFAEGGNSLDYDRYKRLAGEVESRNVQSRLDMTPDERRETLLAETADVAKKDQIFIMNGVDEAHSERSRDEEAERYREQDFLNLTPKEKAQKANALYGTPPIDIIENSIVKKEGKGIQSIITDWAKKNLPTPRIYPTEVGDVVISKNSIKNSLGHGFSQAKLDAVATLIEGFNNAVYLGSLPDFDANPLRNHYFAYPATYKGKLSFVFCRARQDNNSNRLYVHEVFFDENLKSDSLQTSASATRGELQRGIALYKNVLKDILGHKGSENSSTEQAKVEKVGELSEKLHAPVGVIESAEEVAKLPTQRRRKAKGWYDTKTGEVVVVLPNNKDAEILNCYKKIQMMVNCIICIMLNWVLYNVVFIIITSILLFRLS